MTRRILLLNLLLVALTAVAGWRLRVEWLAARSREQAVLNQVVKPLPPPAVSAAPPVPPLAAAAYNDIAQKMLFSRDRNPVVVVDAPPPPPPPAHAGVARFSGSDERAGRSHRHIGENAKAPNREFRPGEQVGEFKLLAIGGGEIVLEWQGKQVTKKIEELKLREEERQEVAVRTETPAPAAAAADRRP